MLKALRLILVITLGTGLAVGCDFSRSESEGHVAQGVESLNAGRGTDAVRAFEAAVAADESNPNAWYYLGYARSRGVGNPGGAVEALQRSTDLDTTNAEAAYQLGYALDTLERSEEAIAAYQTAVMRAPAHVGANLRLGQLLEKTGQFRGAIDAYSNTIHADPSMEIAWLSLGNLYADFGATDAAVAVFNNGIENNLESGELRGALGVTLYESGRLAEAIQSLEQAVEAGYGDTSVTMTLGMSYLRRAETSGNTGDRARALEQFTQASRTCSTAKDGARCAVIATQLHNLSQ